MKILREAEMEEENLGKESSSSRTKELENKSSLHLNESAHHSTHHHKHHQRSKKLPKLTTQLNTENENADERHMKHRETEVHYSDSE